MKKLKLDLTVAERDGVKGVDQPGEPSPYGNNAHHKDAMAFWRAHPRFKDTGRTQETPDLGDWMVAYHELMVALTDAGGMSRKDRARLGENAVRALAMAREMREGDAETTLDESAERPPNLATLVHHLSNMTPEERERARRDSRDAMDRWAVNGKVKTKGEYAEVTFYAGLKHRAPAQDVLRIVNAIKKGKIPTA